MSRWQCLCLALPVCIHVYPCGAGSTFAPAPRVADSGSIPPLAPAANPMRTPASSLVVKSANAAARLQAACRHMEYAAAACLTVSHLGSTQREAIIAAMQDTMVERDADLDAASSRIGLRLEQVRAHRYRKQRATPHHSSSSTHRPRPHTHTHTLMSPRALTRTHTVMSPHTHTRTLMSPHTQVTVERDAAREASSEQMAAVAKSFESDLRAAESLIEELIEGVRLSCMPSPSYFPWPPPHPTSLGNTWVCLSPPLACGPYLPVSPRISPYLRPTTPGPPPLPARLPADGLHARVLMFGHRPCAGGDEWEAV